MSTNKFQSNKLYYTEELGIFAEHENNRPKHDDEGLLDSLKKHGFMPGKSITCGPMVDGKLPVKDGHHRLWYSRQLKIGVWFVIDETVATLPELQTGRSWTSPDYAYYYAHNGHPEYRALLAFQRKHRLTLGAATDLLAGYTACQNSNGLRYIKSGNFKRGDPAHGAQVVAILDVCDTKRLDFCRSSSFVKAVSHVLRIPEVSFDQLRQRINAYGADLQKHATYILYLGAIEALYNKGSRARVPVALRAQEVGRKRQATFGRES